MRLIWGRALALALLLALGVSPGRAAETIKSAVSGAAESSHVFCDAAGATAPVRKAPCVLRSLYVTTGATPGYLMTFNAVAVPANGAVTPVECVVAPANTTILIDLGETAEPYVTGATAAFSTTGCFTLTLSATAFFKGKFQ